jgi:hypothetical protein
VSQAGPNTQVPDCWPRPRDTPIWKLEAALKCRSCKKGRYAPPVHMIKLTATQEITPYQWCIRTRSGSLALQNSGLLHDASEVSDRLFVDDRRLGLSRLPDFRKAAAGH